MNATVMLPSLAAIVLGVWAAWRALRPRRIAFTGDGYWKGSPIARLCDDKAHGILHVNANFTGSRLAPGGSGEVLTMTSSGVPAWASPTRTGRPLSGCWSGAAGCSTIAGAGTAAIGELRPGDEVQVAGRVTRVASVIADATVVLAEPCPTTFSGAVVMVHDDEVAGLKRASERVRSLPRPDPVDAAFAARVARLRAYHARRLGRTVEQLERDGVGSHWTREVLDAQEPLVAAAEARLAAEGQKHTSDARVEWWVRSFEVCTYALMSIGLLFAATLFYLEFGRIS